MLEEEFNYLECEALYEHKRTKTKYRTLFRSFDVQTQKHHMVYLSIDTGGIFNREISIFKNNFTLLNILTQSDIIPKGKV